jgi:hypothetical protein
LDSKDSSPFALSTPATKPNPIRLVPETPASFGASIVARSKAQGVKVKPRKIKRPTSLSSSSSSDGGGDTTSDSELDQKASSPLVISHGSFVAFMDEQRPAAAAAHPSASAKELVSILNAQWRQMTPQQQQRYVTPSLKVRVGLMLVRQVSRPSQPSCFQENCPSLSLLSSSSNA